MRFLVLLSLIGPVLPNPAAKRLYDDLLKESGYNKLVRPVGNNSDTLTVYLGLKLGQLIDVDERNQIMTTNVWLLQRWYDHKLKWDPAKYGNVRVLYVPAEEIWLPDIVLYNNADGNYVVTIMVKAKITYDGRVEWEPPAIYKSYCGINVEFFPFDEQECFMKFGSWTHDGYAVTLKHVMQASPEELGKNERVKYIKWGMDVDGFEESSEWDVLAIPARRKEKFYTCCSEPYPDVTFNITIRRKPLFYTVNLIIPCTAISSLTVFVFYLPSGSKEKIGLGIYTLVSLTVFFLVLVDINPPTSFVVPLMAKYLLFTMILIVVSIFVSVVLVDCHFRSPSSCDMPDWVRNVFIRILPRYLMIKKRERFAREDGMLRVPRKLRKDVSDVIFLKEEMEFRSVDETFYTARSSPCECLTPDSDDFRHPMVKKMLFEVTKIAENMKQSASDKELGEDWQYVAAVLDRLLFYIFSLSWLVGTFGLLLQAPMIYDSREPISRQSLVDWCGQVTCIHDSDYTAYGGDYNFYDYGGGGEGSGSGGPPATPPYGITYAEG